jgi:glycosyltransferase involved in cell wall biosynthesis
MTQQQEPVISVVIPTWNRAQFIAPTIDSVLRQTYAQYEVIVVDDGSTDNTAEILAAYRDKIIYILKQNGGVSSARNAGIQAARGRYIAFVDDDDLWLPDKLSLQAQLMEQNPALGLVYCGAVKIRKDGTRIGEARPEKRGAIFKELVCSNHIAGSASAAMVRRDVFSRSGYFDEQLSPCADWDCWIRIAQHHDVDYVDAPLVHLTIHDSMQKNIPAMERDTFYILDKYWPLLGSDEQTIRRKHYIYSNHCINFAWKYYEAGDRSSFAGRIARALEYDPLNAIYIPVDDFAAREQALSTVYQEFWESHPQFADSREKAFSAQHLQFAWEYYHRGDVRNFRRCIGRIVRETFPRIPLRLFIPYVKSFLGKSVSEKIHAAREKIF